MSKPRAIDLYSGVGGWSLGLRLAGIDVVASYECWGPANETNFQNNQHQARTVDIRQLSFDDLPNNIDIVVGSPPCTQFSFSNRGGGGDLDDGLVDIVRFLSIVDFLKPRVWAMENVPRVAAILKKELEQGGRLHRFAHLGIEPHVVNMEDFGLPQRRRRCVAGNFSFALLKQYVTNRAPTLGNVVNALASDPVIDPIYGLSIPRSDLFDHEVEAALNEEEARINFASKTLHPVYNSMPFPDPLDRTVRTITATCTRVSRESIIVEQPGSQGSFRRLSIRERATLQGFPVTFQFYGKTYSQKLKMVGNAIPPTFTYLVANAFLGTPAEKLVPISTAGSGLSAPIPKPDVTVMESAGTKFPEARTFRFAIPSLRLKSGVRFELSNISKGRDGSWRVAFWFGTSKDIHTLTLQEEVAALALQRLPATARAAVSDRLAPFKRALHDADLENLQKLWSHRGPGGTRPFMLLDELDRTGEAIKRLLTSFETSVRAVLAEVVESQYPQGVSEVPGLAKLDRNAVLIVSGIIVGSVANVYLSRVAPRPSSRTRACELREKWQTGGDSGL